jgi:hypothetical protein
MLQLPGNLYSLHPLSRISPNEKSRITLLWVVWDFLVPALDTAEEEIQMSRKKFIFFEVKNFEKMNLKTQFKAMKIIITK